MNDQNKEYKLMHNDEIEKAQYILSGVCPNCKDGADVDGDTRVKYIDKYYRWSIICNTCERRIGPLSEYPNWNPSTIK